MNINSNDTFSKMMFAGVRFFIAALFLFVFAKFVLKLNMKLQGFKQYKNVFVLGLVQTTVQYSLMYIGVSYTTAAKSSILTSTGVFFIAILAHFLYLNDKLTKNKVIGLILGLIGTIVASLNNLDGLNFEFTFIGEGLIILYQLASAIATIFVKKYSKEIHPVVLTVYQMLFGSLVLIIIGMFGFNPSNVTLSVNVGLVMVLLCFISSATYSIWNMLLKYNKAAEISIFKFATPLFGTIMSVLLLGDILNIYTVIALIFVSAGVFVVYYKKEKN